MLECHQISVREVSVATSNHHWVTLDSKVKECTAEIPEVQGLEDKCRWVACKMDK